LRRSGVRHCGGRKICVIYVGFSGYGEAGFVNSSATRLGYEGWNPFLLCWEGKLETWSGSD
jgi:hypothetical protein